MDPAAAVPPSGMQKPGEALASLSVLQLHGEHDSACGYCDGKTGRFSYGVVASTLTCVDYQALIDVGWRRSGTYMYHPCNQKTCCPNLTIRLDAEKFQPNKQQRRVLRRFQQFLAGEELDAAEAGSGGAEGSGAVRGRSATAPSGLHADGGSSRAGAAHRPSAADLDPLHAFLSDLLLAAAAPMLTVAGVSEAPASLAPAVAPVKSAAAAPVCGVKPVAASALPFKLHGLLRSRAAKSAKPASAAGAPLSGGAPGGNAQLPPPAGPDTSTKPDASSGAHVEPAAALGAATTPLELGRALASRVCDVYASWAAASLAHAAPGGPGADGELCLHEDAASKQWIARLVPPAGLSSASAAAPGVAGAPAIASIGSGTAPQQPQNTTCHAEQGTLGTILMSVAHTGHINFAFPHGGTIDIRRGGAAASTLGSASEKAGAGEAATAESIAWLPIAAASLPAAAARSRSPGPRAAGGASSKAAASGGFLTGTAAAEPSATSTSSVSSAGAGAASPAAKRARRSQDAADATGEDAAAEAFAVQAEESGGESGCGGATAAAATSGTAGGGGKQKAKAQRGQSATGDSAGAGARASAAGGKPGRARTFTVTTVPAAFDREAYALYRRYQMAVHGDAPAECSEKQYTRFLCDSALRREPFPPTAARAAAEAPAGAAGAAGSGSSAGGSGAGAGKPAARGAVSAEDWWSSPGGRAVARCVAGEASAWRDGEGGGAGLPVTASAAHAGDSASSGSSSVASSSSAAAAAGSGAAADAVSSSGAMAPSAVTGRPSGAPHLPRELRFGLFDDPAAAEQHDADMHLGYGSFHQHYRIDGRLIAVGVVDVLPHCLSSVYVYYDPEVSKQLELGKLTALWELQWVQHVRAHVSPRLRYYYMGFYVRSCQKMRYKGEYAPSDLLCPHTWRWVPLADCAPLLDADKYAVLDPAARASPSLIADERRQRLAAAAGAVPATPVFLRRVHADSLVLLRDLTEEGRRIVKEALLGLFERCTPELARRLAVQF